MSGWAGEIEEEESPAIPGRTNSEDTQGSRGLPSKRRVCAKEVAMHVGMGVIEAAAADAFSLPRS